MNTRSSKNKGQRLQKEVVTTLRNKYGYDKGLTDFEGDIQANPMGNSGVDIKLSPTANKTIPFDIECKNTEKASVWQWIKQAETNTKPGRVPLVVFRRNRSKTYAIIDFERLLNLI